MRRVTVSGTSQLEKADMKLASFGEIIWDIYGEQRKIGGAPLNICAHASIYGFDSYLISAVGDDELGKEALNIINGFEINTKYIASLPFLPTGRCIVSLNEKGIPTYDISKNVAYDRISAIEKLSGFDVLCMGTLSLREEHNLIVLNKIINDSEFSEIYADLNIRPPHYSEKSVCFCLENASILKISDEELPSVLNLLSIKYNSVESSAYAISKLYPKIKLIIITLGDKGSFCFDAVTNNTYYSDAVKTNVVSTVGAGDSFGAAFLASYFKDHDIKRALKIASHISSYVVSSIEAIPKGAKAIFESI